MGKPNLVIDKIEKCILVDDEIFGVVELYGNDNDKCTVYIDKVDKLNNLTIIDLFSLEIGDIRLKLTEDFFLDFQWLKKRYSEIIFSEDRIYFIRLDININEWNLPFSFNSFYSRLDIIFENDELIEVEKEELEEIFQMGLALYISLGIESKNIKDAYYKIIETLKSTIDTVISELTQENSSNQSNLTNTFTFPPEIQNSCEQYLIYFATFLKDIGINAETNIESKAHETLFTVIPESGEEALDNIKEALQVYLSLPESPDFENTVAEFTDIGVQQLASQVYFLKSQLMLANSAIQMKDATIKSLNMINYQQSVLIESHQTKEQNEEKIADGLATVNKVKVVGFTLDLPELFRRIKRKFN